MVISPRKISVTGARPSKTVAHEGGIQDHRTRGLFGAAIATNVFQRARLFFQHSYQQSRVFEKNEWKAQEQVTTDILSQINPTFAEWADRVAFGK
jgi:hypothetical protein